jgi:integrase/recombinase XerD
MLSEYFDSPARVNALRAGAAGGLIERFAGALSQGGYAEITARRHLRAAEHFVYWTNRNGISLHSLSEQALSQFACHLPRCRCPHYGHADRSLLHGARLFLKHLEKTGIVDVVADASSAPEPAILTAFCQWMRQQRGTCEKTLCHYRSHIRELLNRLGETPQAFDARSLREFVIEGSQRCGWAVAKKRTTALRMFLRFLIAEGKCAPGLEGAVPVLAHWRLSSLPRYLQPEEIERLIASCDPASAVGQRDRAIMLLLARLGLRAGDIVQMRLQDINWREGWIRVCGKGHREARLPLSEEVGQALITYLIKGRPRTHTDAVFVRCRAPFDGFRSHCAVSVIVGQAFRRAAVRRPSRGAAHLLRHSAACSLLRHGATLQEVAAVLRHRSITTTEIYAKVDLTALRQIALPWPEVQPC